MLIYLHKHFGGLYLQIFLVETFVFTHLTNST